MRKDLNEKQATPVRLPSIRCLSIATQVMASSYLGTYLGNDELALASLKVDSGCCAVVSSPVTFQRRYKEALSRDHSKSGV